MSTLLTEQSLCWTLLFLCSRGIYLTALKGEFRNKNSRTGKTLINKDWALMWLIISCSLNSANT